jgi:hypothetical protein
MKKDKQNSQPVAGVRYSGFPDLSCFDAVKINSGHPLSEERFD